MRVHWFQHVEFEGLGRIEPWLRARGHSLSHTRWWAGEHALGAAASCDWLIIMGGPMNIYQHRDYPWLVEEKAVIAAAVARGARVLGICLGAQLLADVLGGKVLQNPVREIGWWPVRADSGGATGERYGLPAEGHALYWHGDTFTLPPGARRLALSDACAQQAFAWGGRVLALQFHLEMDADSVGTMLQASADEFVEGGPWVQTPSELLDGATRHERANTELLDHLLAAMERA